MHILYLSVPGGGLDTSVRVLAPALARAGHRVSVLYLHLPGESNFAMNALEGCAVHHATIGDWHYYLRRATFGKTRLPMLARAWEYTRTLRQSVAKIAKEKPIDLIEFPEVFLPEQRTHKIPYIMRLHSSAWMCRRMYQEPSPWTDAVEARLESFTLRRANGISSPSAFVADYIRDTCRVQQPIEIIPYPIDTTQFAPAPHRPEAHTILFVGRVEKRKGADVLMRAMPAVQKKFPECEFVFAGSVGEEMQVLTPLRFGEGKGVRSLGVVPRAELVSWYQRTSVFVAPSLWDNSPNTIYEAMACGTPVVATRVGGIPELVDDGETGLLVPPGDADQLADAMIALLSDPARREKMGRAARAKAVAEFALEKILARTLDFYHRAMGLPA